LGVEEQHVPTPGQGRAVDRVAAVGGQGERRRRVADLERPGLLGKDRHAAIIGGAYLVLKDTAWRSAIWTSLTPTTAVPIEQARTSSTTDQAIPDHRRGCTIRTPSSFQWNSFQCMFISPLRWRLPY